ncbi:quinone oxidoreductase PIG3-like isoform X2 [Pomacea canaliculata]|uniref:quinone oxidoreductase PIG3-like isoform X2 n=1 Tax=Pomacea canaliculata TaxID=400727 RepID=UPI000D7365C5|nr:quinone oxidoreductase PIG3-like isoform X2 [Pomacea canaliculata]XP_025096886.1 quinone oxidoreductase PIG3-like isoform X2 [Pomacea canaliculata]XP_025096887.1 quinone oxidoreductase PIG3-like isoform X2 [Pomacea canaliculata]XP_025096888.1 quinone oxidoreductase PIG3-like isoform X2 [Pomacea canaliculata]XP_025096889.1 quinone oxidoreductase PIG3-like isoform X2 [Pomacea canaliculata]XP_025096890.1 quinone oxidoreductase PIG3-like isoform X2 [Pomacea canaliculata]XP_025096891.1 quinone 
MERREFDCFDRELYVIRAASERRMILVRSGTPLHSIDYEGLKSEIRQKWEKEHSKVSDVGVQQAPCVDPDVGVLHPSMTRGADRGSGVPSTRARGCQGGPALMKRAAEIDMPGGYHNLSIGQVPTPTPGSKEVLIQVKATAINRADTHQMMRAAEMDMPGGYHNLSIGLVTIPTPGSKEVLIQVKATAINRADTLQVFPVILGLEVAGIISKLGPGCSRRWAVGDRVMTLLSGRREAEYVVSPEGLLMPIPSGMDFTEAAAILEVWLTAFKLLHTVGKVQAGESVLIHAGASGVGTAAIQLCIQAKAHPYITADSSAKIQSAVRLGAVEGFNYKEENVGARVLEATGGKGVNIILDCVGSSMYEHNLSAIAVDGRWIRYGLPGGGDASGDFLRKVLSKRITLTGTTLRAQSLEFALVSNFIKDVLPLFENGAVKPIIHTVLSLEKIVEAYKLTEANVNTGKIILTVNSGDFDTIAH